MEALCESKAYTITQRFQDVASGALKDRPGFKALQDAAKTGMIDTVIAWSGDRLSRSPSATEELIEACKTRRPKVEIELIIGVFDWKTAELHAAIAKMEREAIRERTALGKLGWARKGKIPGGNLPHGYTRGKDGFPAIVEDDATTIRAIFRMYVHEGRSVPSIHRILEQEHGFRVANNHIYNILARQAYAGGQLSYEGIPIDCPAIVNQSTFDRAQTIKRDHLIRSPVDRPKPVFTLAGLFRCSGCGCRLLARTRREAGRTKRYYRCSMYAKACREHPYIPAAELEERVWREVVDVVRRPDLLVTRFGNNNELAAEIESAEKDLARWTRQNDRLVTYLMQERITEQEYDRQREFVIEPLESARARLGSLQHRQAQENGSEDILQRFLTVAQQFIDSLEGLGDEGRQKVIQELVASATLDHENRPRYKMVVPDAPVIAASTTEADRVSKSTALAWT